MTKEQIQALKALYANVEKQAHSLRGNPREYSVITGLCPVNVIEMQAQKIQALLSENEADKALIAEQSKRIAELEARTLTAKLPPLNDDLNAILGRPNFTCCHLAELLRKSGEDIPRKSEREQAAVIYWFLGIYLEHGDKWESVAKADIQSRAAGITLVVGGEDATNAR